MTKASGSDSSRDLSSNSATSLPHTTVGFISLGCAKNLVDSQIMAGNLVAANIIITPPEEADIIVVNTCSFIHDAREESMEMILSACELKRQGGCSAVLVAGCLPQRYKNKIQEALPDVDAFIGIDQLDDIPAIILDLKNGKHGIISVTKDAHKLFDPRVPVVFSSGANAYLKIAEGCNHRCAFCAIPGIRGKHRSRSVDQIMTEAESLISQGFRELDIISQDVTFYGHDLKNGTNLAGLLKEIGKIDDKFWIRLLYGYPTGITDELLEVIESTPNICNYLDIPIQHSHPEILKLMQRKVTIPYVAEMASRIRSSLSNATIRTTCLVGFPGETEEHFKHLMQYCKEMQFDHLGAFIYSPEEDTTAYDMELTPPFEVAQDRYNRLMEQQQSIVEEKNKLRVGKTIEVLLENRSPDNQWQGRAIHQAPEVDGITIVNNVPKSAAKAQIITAKITDHKNYNLTATYQSPAL